MSLSPAITVCTCHAGSDGKGSLLVDSTLRLAALILGLTLRLLGVVTGDGAHQVLRRWQWTGVNNTESVESNHTV